MSRRTPIPTDRQIVNRLWGGPGRWHSLCYGRGLDEFRFDDLYDDPEKMFESVHRLTEQGYGVWWSAHGMPERPDDGRGKAEHVDQIYAIPADFDWHHEGAHRDADLPSEAELRERLRKVPVTPQIVINSGHGLQVYWLLDEPVPAGEGAELCEGWSQWLLEHHDLHNDRTDLASVLRVPGSINMKIPTDPVQVTVERGDVHRKIRIKTFTDRIGALEAASAGKSSPGASGVSTRGLDAVLAALRADDRDQDADALEVLCRVHDGHHPYINSKGEVLATRPGKKAGTSASVGYQTPGVVRLFTPNWKPFDQGGYYVVSDAGDRLVAEGDDRHDMYADAPAVADATEAVEQPTPVDPVTLAECEATFARWLGRDYDLDALRVMLAAAAVDQLNGDPLWLLIIAGSGFAKTETVQALARRPDVTITSTITSGGALLSATSRKERSKDANGGLLRKIGDRGVLVVKDVTSILSMDRHARAEVLAALREVYDGLWERNVGTDGGRTLRWEGRLAFIGAVTTAWDTHHSVVAAMGDRFVLMRMDSSDSSSRLDAGRRSLRTTGSEGEMRAELADAVAGVLAAVDTTPIEPDDHELETILNAADLVTMARTAVVSDYAGNVLDAHAPEAPTRFAKQLLQVVRGSVSIGMDRADSLRLAIRCARDSLPPLRLAVIDDITAHPYSTTAEIRRRIGKPYNTVDRTLQALQMLDVVQCHEQDHGGVGDARWRWELNARWDASVLDPSTVSRSVGTHTQEHCEGEGGQAPPRTHSHRSGNGTTCGYCTGEVDGAGICLDGSCRGSRF